MNYRIFLFIIIPLAYLVNELIPHGNTADPTKIKSQINAQHKSQFSRISRPSDLIQDEEIDLLETEYALCWDTFLMLQIDEKSEAFPITIRLKPTYEVSTTRFIPIWKPVTFSMKYRYTWRLTASANLYTLNGAGYGKVDYSGKASFFGLMSGRAIVNTLILLAEKEFYAEVSKQISVSIDEELDDIAQELENE